MPRLLTEGEIFLGGAVYDVEGYSWMDHEYSTSALTSDQVGWDWFSLQLNDGSELMVYQIRRQDSSIDPYSSGIWIAANNDITKLKKDEFTIKVNDYWLSKESGGNYPSSWSLEIKPLQLVLDLQPLVQDQELNFTYTYWEGAVRVTGVIMGVKVDGYGYVEMTGYAGTMAGEF